MGVNEKVPASAPQIKLPLASVSIVSQEVNVFARNVPPVSMMPFANVELAAVLLMFNRLAESPWKVEVAVVEVAFNHPNVGVVLAERVNVCVVPDEPMER